jgi:carbonic anhydrase
MSFKKSTLREDLPASLVVFLVALPLCLGVGLASTSVQGISGLPNVFSGIIAGVVGGVIVGFFSGSRIGVSGPAAGLITIVIAAISTLGSFEGFLVAVIIAGIIQVIAGFFGLGILANYFPSSVIKGMLAAIGITLILKEIPHAIGYDEDFFGDEAFFQFDGHNTFSELLYAFNALQPGSIIISILSIAILILFDRPLVKKIALFKILPGALFVVAIGIGLNGLFSILNPSFVVSGKHLVQLPVPQSLSEVTSIFSFPDFSILTNFNVYVIAGTIALVGSLETLLSVEATDKLDPDKHHTPTNRELKAQGIGNIVSGFLGGLPITQVIVRSSANVNAGGKSKKSTMIHGALLMVSVILIPTILNLIPLATLAAILIMVGYKLSKVQLYKQQFRLGMEQFLPFIATIAGVLFTDLLKGIGIGMVFSIFYILRKNYRNNYSLTVKEIEGSKEIKILLSEEVTFLNKGSILESIDQIPKNSKAIIDGSRCKAIDYDVLEIIEEFRLFGSIEKNIELTTINVPRVKLSGGH